MQTFSMLYSVQKQDCSCQLHDYFEKLSSQISVLLDVDKDSMGFKVILRPLILQSHAKSWQIKPASYGDIKFPLIPSTYYMQKSITFLL